MGRPSPPLGSKLRLAGGLMAGALAILSSAPPALAQTVVLQGRIEDAVTRSPVADVRLFTVDSSTVAVTDSLGGFSLRVLGTGAITFLAERVGYLSSRFDLPEGSAARFVIVLLEPEPIELEGIHVVGESALEETIKDLRGRRNAYPFSVSAFDRARLDRVAGFGSVWDFVRRRALAVYECATSSSGLCARELRGRRSLEIAPSERGVRVCVDGRESWGAVGELSAMDIESVALIELYRWGRDGIRVYTPGYIVTSARNGRNVATPLAFGC